MILISFHLTSSKAISLPEECLKKKKKEVTFDLKSFRFTEQL